MAGWFEPVPLSIAVRLQSGTGSTQGGAPGGRDGLKVLELDNMTRCDYIHTMARHVQIAQLKARLSEYLRDVRKGVEVIVLDRKTPIARIVPSTATPHALTIRKPKPGSPRPCDVEIPPPVPGLERPYVLKLLSEEWTPGR